MTGILRSVDPHHREMGKPIAAARAELDANPLDPATRVLGAALTE